MIKLDKVIISPNATIKEAIRQLNENSMQILLVAGENLSLLGTVTDGDIRRELIKGLDLNLSVTNLMHKNPIFLYQTDREKAGEVMHRESITQIPILDSENRVVDLILWKDLSEKKIYVNYPTKSTPVFILAGGKGTRLKPFTNILPKPLIPLGEIPIVEIIMKRFEHYGFSEFILSVNYKADMIKSYFAENKDRYNIRFIQEEEFSGTAGSLSLIKDFIKDTVIVSNCDVIMDIDFDSFLNYHRENKNDATVVGVVHHIKIPYGVMEMKNGDLVSMTEKPEYDFVVNAGIYILESSVVNMVDKGKFLDMPNLLLDAKKQGMKIGIYPSSNEMIDIGHWDEYNLALEKAKQLGLI
jgi:dTDP-glucose pyrophosphorylase/predicted transcriptional regulator